MAKLRKMLGSVDSPYIVSLMRLIEFWQGENLIHFAAFKKHIGIYPGDLFACPV